MSKYTVIIPALNEERSIRKTIEDIEKNIKGEDVKILVVDDGSTDSTFEILKSIKWIEIIRNRRNRGYGYSLKKGIRYVDSEFIIIIDGDGTYPASGIAGLIKYGGDYDMVVGARTGKIVKVPFFRKPAKWFLRLFAEYVTSTRILDLNSGLRLFRRDIALRFISLFPDGFSFPTTLTIACLTNDYSIKFFPINYYERKGKSTIHPIKDFLGFTKTIFRLTIFFKPLNIFIPISLFIFILGFLKLLRDFILLGFFGLGGSLAILGAIQIAFLGILADLIIKRTSI